MKLEFAQIDAKNYDVITIDYSWPKNEHNAKLLGQLKAKYLNSLLKLQEKIARKFLKEAIPNNNTDLEDLLAYELIEIEDEEYRKLAKKETRNLYYT